MLEAKRHGNKLRTGHLRGNRFQVVLIEVDPTAVGDKFAELQRTGVPNFYGRQRFGAAKVRQILGAHGLFSADKSGVKLACVVGCDLKGTPPQAWPRWSHDWTTAARIEAARLDALRLVSR